MSGLTIAERISRLEDIFAEQIGDYEQGWVTIAQEGDVFAPPEGTTLRYGVPNHWMEKTVGTQEGQIQKTSDLFWNDPAPGRRKYIQKKITPVTRKTLPARSGLSAVRSLKEAGRRKTRRSTRGH